MSDVCQELDQFNAIYYESRNSQKNGRQGAEPELCPKIKQECETREAKYWKTLTKTQGTDEDAPDNKGEHTGETKQGEADNPGKRIEGGREKQEVKITRENKKEHRK